MTNITSIFLIFPRKKVLTFPANCHHWRKLAWKVITCFLRKKKKKKNQFVVCWIINPGLCLACWVKISVGNVSGLASCQVWEAGLGHCGESSKHLRKFRVGTLNVNTLRGRVCKVVETLSRRKVDVCCIQETRYGGGSCRSIKGKDTRYKLYWSGNDKGTAGVGVFVAEEWIEKVFEVQRVSDRIILVKLIVGQRVVTFLSVYALQSGLSDEVKDLFFDQLRALTARIPASEFLIPCGDWNGHVGCAGTGYREVHGGMGYGRPEPDVEGERILEYALAFDLLLGNTFQETWQPSHHIQVWKLSHTDRLYPFP